MTEREALREVGNRACQMMLNRAINASPTDLFDRAFYQGELNIIDVYLWPDADKLEAAKAAIYAIPRNKED
jgi:hypothetical protein